MATDTTNNKVIIDLTINDKDAIKAIIEATKQVEALKDAQKGWDKALKEGTVTQEQYIAAQSQIKTNMKDLNQQVKANEKVLLDNLKSQKNNADSLNALRAQLRNLLKAYDDLSKAERDSASGKEMLKHISDLTNEIKGLEYQQEIYKRNVGNYADALNSVNPMLATMLKNFSGLTGGTMKLSDAFKNAVPMVKQFSLQMLKLMANPWVALITAIVAVLTKLVKTFKRNDEAMTALQTAMQTFRPILDAINKLFNKLVEGITKGITAVSNFASWVLKLVPAFKEASDAAKQYIQDVDALEEAERDYTVKSAKNEAEIAELRDKAADKEHYTAEERIKFNKQAQKLEEDNYKMQKDLAKERLRLAKEEAKRDNDNSDERKQKIAELEAAYIKADADYHNAHRALVKEQQRFEREIEQDEKAAKEEQKRRAKEAQQAAKERLKNEKEAQRALEDMYIQSVKDMQTREIAELRTATERRIKDLQDRLNTEKNLTVNAKKYINEQIVMLEAQLQVKIGEIQDKYSDARMKEELNRQKNYYSELLKTVHGAEKDQVQIELVKISTKESKDALDQTLKIVQDTKKAISDDLATLSDEEIMIKYNMDRTGLENLEKEYIKKEQDTADYVAKMKELLAKQEEQAITKIRLDGLNAREAMARTHAELLNEIETQQGLDAFWNNEVEKTKILEEQAKKRLEIAKQNLDRLSNYTEEEQIALYGSAEAYQNELLKNQLAVVKAENDVKEAARNTTQAIQNQKEATIDAFSELGNALNNVLSGFENLFNELAESDDKYRSYSTALAMMQILISTAVSVATAIEGAVKASKDEGPLAPIMLAVNIAAMVGAVVSGIASATATLKKAQASAPAKPKFSTGGPVDKSTTGGMVGTHTTTRKDDTVDAKLSLGEYVIKSEIVKKYGIGFFDELNGTKSSRKTKLPLSFASGGSVPSMTTINKMTTNIDYSEMETIFRSAVADIQPVVSVREINDMQTRVRVKEIDATL